MPPSGRDRFCAGDLKLMDGASRGGIEELRASADAIAKIAKKISGLQLGDKQVLRSSPAQPPREIFLQLLGHELDWRLQEGDAAVQELLQLGFIDPVTSASAGKRFETLSIRAFLRFIPLSPWMSTPKILPLSDTSTNWLHKSARKWAKTFADSAARCLSSTCAHVLADVTTCAADSGASRRFCAYNHKRPLDPVSPEDFKHACERMRALKDCVLRQRVMSSGAVIMEHVSVHTLARQRQQDLAEFAGAKERNGQGVSADEVCEMLPSTRTLVFFQAVTLKFVASTLCHFFALQLFKARGERASFVMALEELKEAEQNGCRFFLDAYIIFSCTVIGFTFLLTPPSPPFPPSPPSVCCCVTTVCKACAFTQTFGRRTPPS